MRKDADCGSDIEEAVGGWERGEGAAEEIYLRRTEM